jgi:hypothetical protein
MFNDAAGVSCGSHRQACLVNESVLVELKTWHDDFCETVSIKSIAQVQLVANEAATMLNLLFRHKQKKKLYITVGGVSCCTVSLGVGVSLSLS